MKKYAEKIEHWKNAKALSYLANFLKNHRGVISDGDVFKPVVNLLGRVNWGEKIKKRFPAKTLERVETSNYDPFHAEVDESPQEILQKVWNASFTRNRMRTLLLDEIKHLLEKFSPEQYRNEDFALRAVELQNTLTLSDLELDILLVLTLIYNNLLCPPESHRRILVGEDKMLFIAKCLDCDIAEVRSALSDKGKLRRYNCIDGEICFNHELQEFMNGVRSEPLSHTFFHLCRDEVLPWKFYGTLAEKHGKILKRIIQSAKGQSSVNILLYGEPGTGKSSFAKTLAAELKLNCYTISQSTRTDDNHTSSTPAFRFGALQVCNSQVDSRHSLIIVDEADDMLRGRSGNIFAMFGGGTSSVGDKGLLNSVLDTVTTPTIWITNTPAGELEESSRRRFDYSIRFDPLNAEQRLSIWRNNVERMKLSKLVNGEMMRKFAARYPVSAGGITLTLQNLAKLAPSPDEVEELVATLMKPHCELLGLRDAAENVRPTQDYSLEGLHVKSGLPLPRLVEAVRNFQESKTEGVDRPRMNILLSGAPGTGKTEFVKYLGAQLGTKVVVRMGSDLLSMYVGGTEKLIRRAFEEAESEHAILFLDEIDGLLHDRAFAQHRWEVTQVNELLYQMENFRGIMVGATNFAANLDAAVLRRFTFKLEFDYLDEAGKKLFFERMFATKLTPAEAARLAAIPNLAPGDYRTVRQGFFYLGDDVSNADRLEALELESAVKKDARAAGRKKMGF